MQDRATEAIKPCDLECVAITQHPQDGVERRPAGLGAAGVINIDVLGGHAGVEERVDLVVRVLLGGRDARVSEEHGVENTGPGGILVVDSRREFSTLLSIECGLAGRASTNDRFSTPVHGLPPRAPGRNRAWGAFSVATPGVCFRERYFCE